MRAKTLPTTTKKLIGVATSVALAATTLTAFPQTAAADEVSPTGKGIVGGALLGGEVVTITEAIIGVKSGWAYAIGFGVGAIGGGVGGYFIEQASSDGRVPVYMLAGGMALIIPAVVLTLNATRFQPSEGATEDKPPPGAPAANPGAPGGSMVAPSATPAGGEPTTSPATTPAPAPSTPPSGGTTTPGGGGAAPPEAPRVSLVDVRSSTLRLGLPVPEVRPLYSTRERLQYGLPAVTALHVPVLAVTF